jgi:hypothetical protein
MATEGRRVCYSHASRFHLRSVNRTAHIMVGLDGLGRMGALRYRRTVSVDELTTRGAPPDRSTWYRSTRSHLLRWPPCRTTPGGTHTRQHTLYRNGRSQSTISQRGTA